MTIDSAIHDAGRPAQRPVTGRMVLIWLIAFFAVVAAVNAIMIRAAVSTFGGLETASAYQAGRLFAQESAAARAQDDLRWQVTGRVRTVGGETVVEVNVGDAAGTPPDGLAALARLHHPADRREDREVLMRAQGAGRFHGTAAPVHGQWDLVIELSRGEERVFRSRNRVTVR